MSSPSTTSTKTVKYETTDGLLFDVVVPIDAPSKNYKYGVRIGPPDLSALGLPKAEEKRLNNALYHRRLLTAGDVKRRHQDVVSAWQSVLGVGALQIVELYRSES